jgi:hypothetical protein
MRAMPNITYFVPVFTFCILFYQVFPNGVETGKLIVESISFIKIY